MLRNILSSELYSVMEEHKFVLDMFHVPLIFFLTYYSLYFSDSFLPDKAIDLVDEAGSRVRLRHAQVWCVYHFRHHPSWLPLVFMLTLDMICSLQLPEEARELEKELRQITKEKNEAVRSQDFEKVQSYLCCLVLLQFLHSWDFRWPHFLQLFPWNVNQIEIWSLLYVQERDYIMACKHSECLIDAEQFKCIPI